MMIQVTCTWVLVMLAASPFTAPFATCDLSVLLGRTAGVHVVPLAQSGAHLTATLVTTDPSSDADSVSPVVTRTDLGKNDAFRSVGLLTYTFGAILAKACPPLDASQSPHG